ncbi:acyltransferase [Bacillus mycoides]|nr:acyltransferase [Bacillus mycoides]QWH37296.1 acyltransferase [Bacillus mycoides]
MGSVLYKDSSIKVWPVVIGSTEHYKKHLYPISEEDGIEPRRMLATYLPLISSLKSSFNVVEFIYDWRRNNLEHLHLLKQEIESLDVDVVHIVAHSMGGIIAKLCLNKYRDEECMKKVGKLITIGTPWKGSMDAVKTLFYGAKIPEMKFVTLLTKECSKEISKSFPSLYQLLPNRNFLTYLKDNSCVPYNFKGEYYDDFDQFYLDLLKEDFTQFHDFSKVFEEYYELLNKDLQEDIEMHEIIGTGRPTIKILSENAREEPSALYDEGDSTVPIFSAYSNLEGLRSNYYPYFVNKGTHSILPTYPKVIALVKEIINENSFTPNETVFDDLSSPFYKKFNGYIGKVACPVEVSITDNTGKIIYGNIETINENEIKELLQAEYEVSTVGTTTYVIFDQDEETNIDNYDSLLIEAYDEGLTSISFDEYVDGKLSNRKAFKTFTIDTDTSVRVDLSSNVKDSSLILDKNGNKEVLNLEEISVSDNQIEPPNTTAMLDGEYVIEHVSNVYFGKGDITLRISEVIAGTYQPKQTVLLVNGKEYTLDNDGECVLDKSILNHGENEIEYFSIDEYDYTENKKKIILYYFYQTTTKVEFLFTDKFYVADIAEDKKYASVLNTYEFTRVPPQYQFENQEGVTGRQVVYHNMKRKLQISYRDIFNDEITHNYVIDEILAKKIIHGAATVGEVEKFVELLNLRGVDYQFHPNKRGNFTTLNDDNLNMSIDKFEIISEDTKINIKKDVQLIISFENMAEHIKISANANYRFAFKVIDSSQTYVPNLSLKGEFRVTINDKLFMDEVQVEYNEAVYSYEFTLNLNTLYELNNAYWKKRPNTLSNAILEIIDINRGNTLRTVDLQIVN